MEEREMTFTLSEDLYRTLQQRQGDNLDTFVRQAVIEKLATLDSSESVGGEERTPSPLLKSSPRGWKGKMWINSYTKLGPKVKTASLGKG